MSASANPDNDVAVPCANNCGFWGTAATNNLCSSCYKEKIGDLKNKNNSNSSSSSPVTEKKENKFESESKSEAEVESKTSSKNTTNSNTLLTKRTQADATSDAVETKIIAQEKAQPKALAVEDLSIKDNASGTAVVSEKLDEKKPVERKVQKNRHRCFECKKRVGLTGNECRCGYVFCGTHRYPEQHKCDFDFHGFAKTNLSKKATESGAMADKIQGERL